MKNICIKYLYILNLNLIENIYKENYKKEQIVYTC